MDRIDEWLGRAEKVLKGSNTKNTQDASNSDQKENKSSGKPGSAKSGNQKNSVKSKVRKGKGRSGQRSRQNNRGGKSSNRSSSGNPAGNSHKKSLTPTRIGKPTPILKGKLKVIPLGGLNEVGKNMMAFEYEDDIIIVDMGFEFPSEDLLGVDYIIPDVSYLEDNKDRIRGVLITHGHLDHIGGIPYILPKLGFPPVYSLKLTVGLIQKRTEEFKQDRQAKVHVAKPDEPIKLGKFLCRFIRIAHSVPDAAGLEIVTPVGRIVHTGDFKFDEEPAGFGHKTDEQRLAELGRQGVLALFSDSTNSLKPGHTMPEKQVGETLDRLIGSAKNRIIIASFSSVIGRIQQILEAAQKHKRKVYISGRSMQNNIDIASRLGYLRFPPDLIHDIKKYKSDTPDTQALILTTGSQGEAFSALTKISMGTHSNIKVKKGDTIVLSSSPIVGNERAVTNVINNLCMLGAEVIHNQLADVHTSGHAKRDELKKMIQLVRPKYFLPVHGEYYMRQAHAKLANQECGIPNERIIILQNGEVLYGEPGGKLQKSHEKVETKYILIDGTGEGQMGSQVQVDREIMSRNGVLIVLIYIGKKSRKLQKRPDVLSRGFTYMHEADIITGEIIDLAEKAYRTIQAKNPGMDRRDVKRYIKQSLDKFTNERLERRPLIVPIIVES